MSKKEYTPAEVGVEILKKCQQVYSDFMKKKEELDKCGEMTKEEKGKEVENHESEVRATKLKEYLEAKKKKEEAQEKENMAKEELDKCGEMNKEQEMDKCGEMTKEEKEKKKVAEMEKMMDANSAPAPTDKPKPSIATQINWPNTK